MNKYRVHLHSKPGMWEYYEGYVDVFVEDSDDAFIAAARKLRQTSFHDRPANGWVLDSVEKLS